MHCILLINHHAGSLRSIHHHYYWTSAKYTFGSPVISWSLCIATAQITVHYTQTQLCKYHNTTVNHMHIYNVYLGRSRLARFADSWTSINNECIWQCITYLSLSQWAYPIFTMIMKPLYTTCYSYTVMYHIK